MTTFVCAISGHNAEEPVVSPSSGEIFEKRLIVKYIEENGKDPVTNESLSVSDLVTLKLNDSVRASLRPMATASIPVLLKTLQDEWDACMLNGFTLRQELQAAREELTHALYQNDAACRVINRLSLELQSARSAMANLPAQRARPAQQPDVSHNGAGDVEMSEGDLPGLNEDAVAKITAKSEELSTQRRARGRKLPEGLAGADVIGSYSLKISEGAIHSTGTPGITCLDLQGRKVLTGGVDKTLQLYDLDSEQIDQTFKGHRKPITDCIIHPEEELILSSSADTNIHIYTRNGELRHSVNAHSGSVTGISLHPTQDYVLASSEDTYWSLVDLHIGNAVVKVRNENEASALLCGQIHPDGLIYGAGTRDCMVKIWEIRDQQNVATFPGHNGEVTTICFSENGYYLASGGMGEVKLWDLRKLSMLKSIPIGDGSAPITAVRFDASGHYLAAASDVVQILQTKTWKVVNTFSEAEAKTTAIRFAPLAEFLVTASMDRFVRLYGQ